MQVLVVGGGGREHALAWGLMRSPVVVGVFVAPAETGVTVVAVSTGGVGDERFGVETVVGVTFAVVGVACVSRRAT